MIQQRPSTEDDKDIKPKLLEGAYLKMSTFPAEINIVSTNNISGSNTSIVTSKHNYSLPPQADFSHQPITLIGQTTQQQNKVRSNPTNSGQANFAIATSIQDMQNKITIPSSNIKLNIVPSLAQVMQSGGLVIDAKSLNSATSSGEHKPTTTTLTGGAFVTAAAGTSTSQQHFHQQQFIQHSAPGMQQQPKVKLEKTMNMMYDIDRNRILYTNLKGNRGGTQFLAQINPKVVNLLPIQHKNNVPGTVQTIVTQSNAMNKTIEHVITSPIPSRLQQQLNRKKMQEEEMQQIQISPRVQQGNLNTNIMSFSTPVNTNDNRTGTENTRANFFVATVTSGVGSDINTMRKASLSKILTSTPSRVSISSSAPTMASSTTSKTNAALSMSSSSSSSSLPIGLTSSNELVSINMPSGGSTITLPHIASSMSVPANLLITRNSLTTPISSNVSPASLIHSRSKTTPVMSTESPATTLLTTSPPLLSLTLTATTNSASTANSITNFRHSDASSIPIHSAITSNSLHINDETRVISDFNMRKTNR